MENRQKIPVPRRSFLWSLNETSGEILTHVGPTEFTPSANDRIVRANTRGGYEQASMEARPFIIAGEGEYVLLRNPVGQLTDEGPNGAFVPGGNKEKDLKLGTTKVIPGPCAFPLWPGQEAEVRAAHKLGANHYLLVEVVGPLDEAAPYYALVMRSAELSSVVIDPDADEPVEGPDALEEPARRGPELRIGQRIVIQGRHTQFFIPPTGIEVVPAIEEEEIDGVDEDAVKSLPDDVSRELAQMVSQVSDGMTSRQFSVLKNELRHRNNLTSTQRAVMLTVLDDTRSNRERSRRNRRESRQKAQDRYARKAVVLGPKNFCVLFDADGNPRIVRGPARVFPGPHDTFLQRGSRRRVYDAYELGEHQALWLRIISPISKEKLAGYLPDGFKLDQKHYAAGHELLVRGNPSVFFPFIEAEVVHPETREPHVGNSHDEVVIDAIGIDQKSGIYVRNLRSGKVTLIRGETSYLVDPRFEKHVHRRVPVESWNLWIGHGEAHKVITDGKDRYTPWAVSVIVPNNEAVLITSRHGRRVAMGPKTELLEFEEQLTPIKLSKGPSKDGRNVVRTCFLRVKGGRVTDTFEIESADFVRFRVKLGVAGHFEGDESEWFNVEDPVKLLADVLRARLRNTARTQPAIQLLSGLPSLVKATFFAEEQGFRFPENGMVIDTVDVLSVAIADPDLAQSFDEAQREAVALQLKDTQATRRLESARHQDEIESEEHSLARASSTRMAETTALEAEDLHRLEVKKQALEAARAAEKQEQTQARNARQQAFDLEQQYARGKANADRLVQHAEADAEATRRREAAALEAESTRAALARESAKAMAEADAIRLEAIQKELVGALHAAADAEVMKAAAENMNLVALLGGKSPAELFSQLLKGTPLSRTPKDMSEREE
ncbi:MAG: hypothetical protein ACE366_19385 [Bradymonadia bacterium]